MKNSLLYKLNLETYKIRNLTMIHNKSNSRFYTIFRFNQENYIYKFLNPRVFVLT